MDANDNIQKIQEAIQAKEATDIQNVSFKGKVNHHTYDFVYRAAYKGLNVMVFVASTHSPLQYKALTSWHKSFIKNNNNADLLKLLQSGTFSLDDSFEYFYVITESYIHTDATEFFDKLLKSFKWISVSEKFKVCMRILGKLVQFADPSSRQTGDKVMFDLYFVLRGKNSVLEVGTVKKGFSQCDRKSIYKPFEDSSYCFGIFEQFSRTFPDCLEFSIMEHALSAYPTFWKKFLTFVHPVFKSAAQKIHMVLDGHKHKCPQATSGKHAQPIPGKRAQAISGMTDFLTWLYDKGKSKVASYQFGNIEWEEIMGNWDSGNYKDPYQPGDGPWTMFLRFTLKNGSSAHDVGTLMSAIRNSWSHQKNWKFRWQTDEALLAKINLIHPYLFSMYYIGLIIAEILLY